MDVVFKFPVYLLLFWVWVLLHVGTCVSQGFLLVRILGVVYSLRSWLCERRVAVFSRVY